jgi:hypothetical protein
VADRGSGIAQVMIVARVLRMEPRRFILADSKNDDITVVPIPASESQAEHDRIRKSNDRDQKLEREGKVSRHNQGYDEAADGVTPPPEIERVVDQ